MSFNAPDDSSIANLLGAATNCASLRSLDVTGITLNNLGIKALAALVASTTKLTALRTGALVDDHTGDFTNEFPQGFLPIHAESALASLHTNSVGGAGLLSYMQTMASTNVVDVGLGANVWDAGSWDALCGMLKDHKSVKSLDLTGSTVPSPSDSIRSLLKNAQANGVTESLTLNQMDVGGIKGVGEGLAENKVLQSLELSGCNFAASSKNNCAAFVTALHSPISLKVLHLRNNNLDSGFLLALVEGLKGNTSLEEVYLSGNVLDFTPALAKIYGGLVCASSTLRKLEMFDIDLGETRLPSPTPPKLPDDRKVKPRSNRTPRVDIEFKEGTCPATIGDSCDYGDDERSGCGNCGLLPTISMDFNVTTAPGSRASTRPPTRGSPIATARGSPNSSRRQTRDNKDVFVAELAAALEKVSNNLVSLDVGRALLSGTTESQRKSLVGALEANPSNSLQQLLVRGVLVGQAAGEDPDDLEWNALAAALSTNRFGSLTGTVKIVC